MELLYKTSATSVGGRDGHVRTEDGTLDLDLKPPTNMGGPGGATNPEQLFSAGYAACFNGALNLGARLEKVKVGQTTVKVEISLNKNDEGSFQLGAVIDVTIPGVDETTARHLAEKAHTICPYSRATRGNIDAKINVKTV